MAHGPAHCEKRPPSLLYPNPHSQRLPPASGPVHQPPTQLATRAPMYPRPPHPFPSSSSPCPGLRTWAALGQAGLAPPAGLVCLRHAPSAPGLTLPLQSLCPWRAPPPPLGPPHQPQTRRRWPPRPGPAVSSRAGPPRGHAHEMCLRGHNKLEHQPREKDKSALAFLLGGNVCTRARVCACTCDPCRKADAGVTCHTDSSPVLTPGTRARVGSDTKLLAMPSRQPGQGVSGDGEPTWETAGQQGGESQLLTLRPSATSPAHRGGRQAAPSRRPGGSGSTRQREHWHRQGPACIHSSPGEADSPARTPPGQYGRASQFPLCGPALGSVALGGG